MSQRAKQNEFEQPTDANSPQGRGWLRVLVVLLSFLWIPFSLEAQLPVARLASIFPPGGKAGTTFEATLSGVDLDDASRIHFSHDGITAKPKIPQSADRPEPNKFVVNVASNVPPGIYEARVVCRFGISNPRAFAVSDHPEIIEASNNQSPTSAGEVALQTIVNGHTDANAADYFKITAHKGRRILIDCLAKVIDSRMDPVLVLFDANGREVDRNRRGGLLDFTPEADGPMILKVHDFLFRGGEDYFYRLAVNAGPHLDFVFPPSGLAGTKSKYTLYGRNLPDGTPSENKVDGKLLDQVTVEIELPPRFTTPASGSQALLIKPADAPVEAMEYRLRTADSVSNPSLISLAADPVVAENGPNDKPESAQKVALPCEFVGQFYPKGDRDWIAFEAKKGEAYWVEVFSHRLGWPTDPFVVIQRLTKNDKGEEQMSDVQELSDLETNIGGPEFNTATRDLQGRFEAKENGMYRLQVRDLFNYAESDPRFVYRLSIRKESPDFRLVALPQPPPPINRDKKEALPWTPFLRKGETIAIKVLAFRRDNFNGEIQLSVEGLPAGVRSDEAKIESGKSTGLILLTADEKAAGWVGTIRILGTAKIGEASVVREARAGGVTYTVPDYNNEPVQARIGGGVMIGVSEKETMPLSVGTVEDKIWETSLAGKLQIPVKVLRRGDFNDSVKLKAAGLPALDPMKEIDVNNKTNETVLPLDLTQLKIPVGTHTFYLQTQTKGKYRRMSSQEVKESEAGAKSAEDALKQAEKEAAEHAAAAKKAGETLTAATKAAQEAETHAKAASEKLASAKSSAEKTPANEESTSARATAEKEADKALAKSKAAAEAKTAAEKVSHEATARAKESEKKKESAARRSKETKQALDKAQAKELTMTAYSMPIHLKVLPAPLTLTAEVSTSKVEQGGKIEIPVRINRLYGFADSVELTLVAPKNASGLTAAKVTVPKDQSHAKLVVEAGHSVSPGEHELTLQASLKFNNQDLKADQPLILKVEAAEKPKS